MLFGSAGFCRPAYGSRATLKIDIQISTKKLWIDHIMLLSRLDAWLAVVTIVRQFSYESVCDCFKGFALRFSISRPKELREFQLKWLTLKTIGYGTMHRDKCLF